MEIIDKIITIVKTLGVETIKCLIQLCIKIVDVVAIWQKQRIQNAEDKKISDAENKVDDACNNGSLNDLITATEQLGETVK